MLWANGETLPRLKKCSTQYSILLIMCVVDYYYWVHVPIIPIGISAFFSLC